MNRIKLLNIFQIYLLFFILNSSLVIAGTFNPRSYWEFSNTSNMNADTKAACPINFSSYGATYTANGDGSGKVGNYITNITGLTLACEMPFTAGATISAASVEFLIKAGKDLNKIARGSFILGNSYFNFSIKRDSLVFYTAVKGAGSAGQDTFTVNLEGIGRRSPSYYTDGNWHHIALTYNAVTGIKRIWVDGQSPSEFQKTVSINGAGTLIEDASGGVNRYIQLGTNTSYDQAKASLDQIAIYETEISSTLIYEHYLQAMNGQTYNFTEGGTIVPPAASTTGTYDMNEYAPGQQIPMSIISNPYNGNGQIMVSGVSITPIDQLKSYQAPRFKPGNTLTRIVQWYDPNYAGGQQLMSNSQAALNAKEIQKEMALNWNHMLSVYGGGASDEYNTQYIALANQYPTVPLSLTTLWAQINPQIMRKDLPASMYLQGTTTLSPAASDLSYADQDGTTMRNRIQSTINLLTARPAGKKIDHIDENGELLPIWSQSQIENDPNVIADKAASGISDWSLYIGNRWARIVKHFRDQIVGGSYSLQGVLPGLENTVFAHYYIDGFNSINYDESRFVNTPKNGNYHATPDMYVGRPWWWDKSSGNIHGLSYIDLAVKKQISVGDKLFSPYVNACFEQFEENCLRPGQYLGMLKILGMFGAEFFYAGYFSTKSPWPDPKAWIWQAAMPSYAQAVVSRVEDYLRNGTSVAGDSLASPDNVGQGNGQRIWGGKSSIYVAARKLNNAEKYVISGMVGAFTNYSGATPLEDVATSVIGGNSLTFKVRRQGSTYIYDKTDAANPVFYQLDGWHEYKHPSYWSKDFLLEAELFDNITESFTVKTTGAVGSDFTAATSYIQFANITTKPKYKFFPRMDVSNPNQTSRAYYTYIKARALGGNNTGVSISVDGGANYKSVDINNSSFAWCRLESSGEAALLNVSLAEHELALTPKNTNLEVDAVLVSTSATPAVGSEPYNGSCAAFTNSSLPSMPTGISLVDPVSSPSKDTTPTLRVSGVTSGHTVGIFTNNTCTTQVGSAVAGASTVDISTSVLTSGTYTLYAKATNANGSSPCSTSYINYLIDTTVPTVSVTSPTAGSVVGGTAVTVSLNATDNVGGSGISRVEFLVDNVVKATSSSSPATILWNTIDSSNASHNIKAKAYDNAGNVATSAIIAVTVTNTAPAAVTGLTGSAISNSSVNLQWAHSGDNEQGFKVYYKITSTGTWTLIKTIGVNSTSTTVTGLTPNTDYFWRVRAYNKAGLSATGATINVKTPQ